MLNVTRRPPAPSALALFFAALALLAPAAVAAQDNEKSEPPFIEYKGVRIGMPAADARKKLGDPADKGDQQDYYSFSESETAQIFYDTEKKVFAISVIYVGAKSGAPVAKAVLGTEVEPKPDGSVHQRLDFPKAGCWVAYSRTAGDDPLITITLQKKD